jgi:uncharacterized protein YlxP (DUF503 family)
MFVGAYRIELFIPHAHSLKEKRSVVNGIKNRLAHLNVSVAEVDGQDLWQRATLGVAAVSAESRYLDDLPTQLEAVVQRDPRATLLRVERDVRPMAD